VWPASLFQDERSKFGPKIVSRGLPAAANNNNNTKTSFKIHLKGKILLCYYRQVLATSLETFGELCNNLGKVLKKRLKDLAECRFILHVLDLGKVVQDLECSDVHLMLHKIKT
jgi:hypothetical protein